MFFPGIPELSNIKKLLTCAKTNKFVYNKIHFMDKALKNSLEHQDGSLFHPFL